MAAWPTRTSTYNFPSRQGRRSYRIRSSSLARELEGKADNWTFMAPAHTEYVKGGEILGKNCFSLWQPGAYPCRQRESPKMSSRTRPRSTKTTSSRSQMKKAPTRATPTSPNRALSAASTNWCHAGPSSLSEAGVERDGHHRGNSDRRGLVELLMYSLDSS